MNCKNCGCLIESGAAFCTNCGTKVDYQEAVKETAEIPANETVPAPESGVYEKIPPVQPIVPPVANVQSEKVDFGKGALAFCLVVIGILAITTGVFAGLYFSVI